MSGPYPLGSEGVADKRDTTEDAVPRARTAEPSEQPPVVSEPASSSEEPRPAAGSGRAARASRTTKAAGATKAARAAKAGRAKAAAGSGEATVGTSRAGKRTRTRAASAAAPPAAPVAEPLPVGFPGEGEPDPAPPAPAAEPAFGTPTPAEPAVPTADEPGAAPAGPTVDEPGAAPATPAEPGPAALAEPGSAPAGSVVAPGAWAAAAWDALQHADQPPRALATLAVTELGPRAARWAGWLRQTYPGVSATGLARLATHQATRAGWALAAVEAGGPVTAPLLLPAAGLVRATVVLRVAAAYGFDPTHSDRVPELIELLDLEPEPGEDPLGWSGVGRLAALAGGVGGAGRYGAVGLVTRRLGLRRSATAVLRGLLAVGEHTDQLRLLASRATRYYRARQPGEH